MAFPVTLNGRTYTLADFSGTNYVEGFPDALEDFVTQAGDIYNSTSTTSNSIGIGSKTFTVEANKPYQAGTPLRIADAAAPATNFMDVIVTSYSGTSLVVSVFGFAGSGTYTSWTVNIGGAKTVDGTLPVAQGGTGATTAADARTNLDTYSKSEADSRFLNVSGEASDVTMTGNVTIGDAAGDTLTVNATATLADATLTTADINGGTIDGTVIGGSTPAAISGTTLTTSSTINTLTVGRGAGDVSTNTAVGSSALFANTSGSNNASFGLESLRFNTTGSSNSGFGRDTLYSNTTGSLNTAVGKGALLANTTASNNTAVGHEAAYSNTTGINLTAIGLQSLYSNTTGFDNVAVGTFAFYDNTTGSNNVAVGKSALENSTTASNNTAVGFQAGFLNTTGTTITALGQTALYSNTTGNEQLAVGNAALFSNTTGGQNTALGVSALQSNTTASYNTAVGHQAGFSNTTSQFNTFLGFQAGYSQTTPTNGNTCIGASSGYALTTGTNNTFIGSQGTVFNGSGGLITTGSKNTVIGNYNGNQGGLDIRTGSNNIVLSDGDGNVRLHIDGSGNVGIGGTASGFFKSNTNKTGNGSVANFNSGDTSGSGNYVLETSLQQQSNNTNNSHMRSVTQNIAVWHLYGNGTMSWSSDERLKKNIETTRDGYLEDLSNLRVVKYNWHSDEDGTPKELGLIAQEVEQVFPNLIATDDVELNGLTDAKVIKGSVLPYMLLKALQEANSTIKELEARIAALESA